MEIVHYGGAGYETPECSRLILLDDDCNPYDEPQPFVRGRIDRNGYSTGYSSIDRDNSLLHRKLTEIQSRSNPYAARHYPGKVKNSHSQPQLPGQSFVHHTAHTASRGKSPQKARAQEVAACNAVMAKKLNELYAVRKDSFVVQNHLGKGIDCNERWQQRTSMYSSSCCSSAGMRSSGSGSRPSTAPAAGSRSSRMRSSSRSISACGSTAAGSGSSTGVPKTMGVALCAGCGCRSFFNADGAQLQPCPGCGHAFYCSDACRQFDYSSHKAECRFHSTGRWHAAGIKPSEDCWVMNRAMAAARRMLQQQHRQPNNSSSRPGTAHAVDAHRRNVLGSCSSQRRCESAQHGSRSQAQQEAYQACNGNSLVQSDWQQQLQQQLECVRVKEQQEVLAQQQVELRASQGLDGPRPCLCSNGLEQLGGQRARNPSSSAAAAAAAQTCSTSNSTAGGASSRRAGGRTWRGGKGWKGVHEA